MMSQPQHKPEESTDGRRHQMVLRAGSGLTSVTSKNQKMEAEETNPKSETQDTETQAGAMGGVQEETTVEKTARQQPSRPASQVSRSSARRPMSQVSCSSASSRASVEAQLTAKLKNLRVKQMERKMELERQDEQKRQERKNQENELMRQENESKRQRELRELKDEAEEAELEARLRMIMEDDLNADRNNDFLYENIGETENDRSFQPKQEMKTPPCSSLPQPQQEPVSQPSPQRNSVTWIDELPGTAASGPPLKTGSPPSGHASAFVKSIPRLTLPVYSGDPLEWPRWVGLFRALIHEQPSLSDSERMAHLQASVTGTAQQAIVGMFLMESLIGRR